MKKRLFILLLSLIFAVCGLTLKASAAEKVVYSGKYESISYKVTEEGPNGYTLTLIGSGELTDKLAPSDYPWYSYNSVVYAKKITKVNIENGITNVPAYAFSGYKSLESIFFGANVVKIGERAFDLCTSLKEIDFQDSVVSVGDYAFSNCINVKSINFGKRLTDINEGAFANNTGLVSIDIPGNVKNIGLLAFSGCSSLENINFAKGIQVIGVNAFKKCVSLKSITINGVATVAHYAFSGCTGLKSAIFTDGVKKIGAYVFNGCTSLESVTIADSILEIGTDAIPALAEINGYEGTAAEEYAGKKGNAFFNMKGKYNVLFYGNGATGGSTENMKGVVSADVTYLNANGFVRKGYTFTGWNTSASGSGRAFSDGEKIKGLGDNGDNIELFAQWKINTYKITYNLNGGKNSKSNPKKLKVTTAEIVLADPTYTGYIFKGWYTDSALKNKITSIPTDTAEDVSLYAKWKPITYSVSFNGNGADSGKKKTMKNCKYDTSYDLDAGSFKKYGYTLVGWNTKANGKGKTYKTSKSFKNLTKTDKGSVTLYAVWEKTKYYIDYHLDKDVKNSSNPKYFNYDSGKITLKVPYKKGYVFYGWYIDEGLTVLFESFDASKMTGFDVFPKWGENSYNIEFNANTGDGRMDKITAIRYFSDVELPAPTMWKHGYVFDSWNTKADGTGTKIKNKATVSQLGEGKTVILYAQWKKKK